MRKIFWGLTAVSVAAVGGMVWLKCLGTVSPWGLVASAAIQCCRHGEDSQTPSVGDDYYSFQRPDDPVEIVDSQPQDDLPEPTPLPGKGTVSGAVDFDPAPVVPAITIREEGETLKPVTVAPSDPWTAGFNGDDTLSKASTDPAVMQAYAIALALAAANHEVVPAPPTMPYATDDDEVVQPKMPYADDDDDQDGDDCCRDNKTAAQADGFWSLFFPKATGHTAHYGSDKATPTDDDSSPVYPTCPYCGPCMPQLQIYSEPQRVTPPPVTPGGEEGSEEPPVLKKKSTQSLNEHFHKLLESGEEMPGYPSIDTMEFRPSDHSPYERALNHI